MKALLLAVSISICAESQAAPPPGHPTPDQAGSLMGVDATEKMDLHGEVLESIQSNSYTYIRVQTGEQQSQWLAAPRLLVQPGQSIDYPQGVVMRNFFSKKLQRTFEQVSFVPKVRLTP